MTRVEKINAALRSSFRVTALNIEDESHLHAGHVGALTGRGHFRLAIVSADFEGQSAMQRHRAIYAALGDLMQTDIHALSIRAQTPGENA